DDITEKTYEDLFFTNLIPGFRASGKSTGGFSQNWITETVKEEFKALVEILEPQIIICLGRAVYESVLDIYEKEKKRIG
ncbi:MAG: uracil-DNA glycosylase family protein, partial [Lachnospiraceae bacterium]|nr:uracil-DNA glycosylase family protein [Lachnospiraceae bacterium]